MNNPLYCRTASSSAPHVRACECLWCSCKSRSHSRVSAQNGTGLPVALWRVTLLGECQLQRGVVCVVRTSNTRDKLTANGRHLSKGRTISIAPFQIRQILSDHLGAAETRWAWHAPTPQQRASLTEDLLTLIRAVGSPALRQSSIRRGALQRMATLGASEEDLMHFSGHTNVRTLRRYLGWNKVSATAERTQALGAKHTAQSPAL